MALIDQAQLTTLRELAGTDDSFLASVIEAFLPQLETFPEALRAAAARADADTLVEVAHSLKGSAGNVGAEDVQRLAVEIESLACSGELEEVPRLVDELVAKAAQTRRAYEAEKAKLV